MKVSPNDDIFYVTKSKMFKLLRFNSQIPRKILGKVKYRKNGKSLKSKKNFLLVQEDDFTIFKFDVENVDRIKSQKFRISGQFGEISDFDYNEKKNWIFVLTAFGSVQVLDGTKKFSITHKPKKLSSNFFFNFFKKRCSNFHNNISLKKLKNVFPVIICCKSHRNILFY